MSKILKALAVAAVATTALSGVAKEAEASSFKKIHVIKFGHVYKPVFHKPYVHFGFKPHGFYKAGYAAPVYHAAGCGFYLHKWQATGSWFWKHKYLNCKY